ncbi:Myb-like_DNA-binding domain-containing protein [Hexamita inflata]|uniref:Myb-like DNA-binding domain-containing protein n=1 Tax=Hexamita inflata TaxID=28002 RepID=A0AA86QIJ8_9EUKA|nr:Myb-like DNA-binding domain-containing protein [Hexamita inflata]
MPCKWSQEDITQLLTLIEQNRTGNRINWKQLILSFPDRTIMQCKSYYTAKLQQNAAKTNMQWNYMANLLLAAFVFTYGTNWQFISENCYQGKITANALRKQFGTVQRAENGMITYIIHVLNHGIERVSIKAFMLYVLLQALDFRLQQTCIKMQQLDQPTEIIQDALLPPIFDQIPKIKNDIYSQKADQLVYITFYRTLESKFQIHKYIAIIDQLILKTDSNELQKIFDIVDDKRTVIHQYFI